jgi:hypothetical protein
MPTKRISERGYRQLYDDIAPYVYFKIPKRKKLDRKQRKQIRDYHAAVGALKARPFQLYKGKSKKNLHAVQRFAQHPHGFNLRVAFVPTNGVDKLTIRVSKKGKVSVSSKHVTTVGLEFDMVELALDPQKEVERVIKKDKSDYYAIRADEFEIPDTYTPDTIALGVTRKVERYQPGGEKYQDYANGGNHWNRWMFGLNGYKLKNQDESMAGYMHNKIQAKRAYQRKNKKLRNDGRSH